MTRLNLEKETMTEAGENSDVFLAALEDAVQMVEENLELFTDAFPHVSVDGYYIPEENEIWTSAFYPGMCSLAYEVTQDEKFIKCQENMLDSFEKRLDDRIGITHDLGFLYTLSCVSLYKLTGNQRAYRIAQRAASMLAERYHETPGYIQAWGEMGIGYPEVKIIIDCMMNLPLLYWSGNKTWQKMAKKHAETSAAYLIREDASSYHTYLMDPEAGKAVCGKTAQGYADESTWARGQAWAVYGFALSYRYTGQQAFLDISRKAAEVFIRNLPADLVPYWDFTFTDKNPDIRDTSAGAIFCCGLLELCKYVSREESERFRKTAENILLSLYRSYAVHTPKKAEGLLREGMYHREEGSQSVIWGDYFYMEALVRCVKDWQLYW